MSYIPSSWKKRSKVVNNNSSQNCAFYATGDGNYANVVYDNIRSYYSHGGWAIPNFHKKYRAGELLPETPFTSYSIEGSSVGHFDFTNDTTGKHYWCSPSTSFNKYDTWIITADELEAYVPQANMQFVQEAAARIYSSGFDALTFLAELSDVRHLFRGALTKLIRLDFPRNWKSLSNDWLSTRYGWRTLIYDIKEINELIIGLNRGRERYSETAGTTYTTSNAESGTYSTGHGTRSWLMNEKVVVGLRGHVVADVKVPELQFNPLQTAWEVIPFSFVIDWFVSVGSALQAMSFLSLHPDYVASYGYSVKIERTFDCSIESEDWSGHTGVDDQQAVCEAELRCRIPCRVPLPPRHQLKLNAYKVTDLFALLFQRIR